MSLVWPAVAWGAPLAFEVRLAQPRGAVTCRLYDAEASWLKAPVAEVTAIAEAGVAICRFPEVRARRVAVSAYHDENRNGRLDTGLFGIPAEPVCVSNGVRPRFGPPRWDDAVFDPSRDEARGCEAR